MRIKEDNADLSEPKTLKVTLPARLHLQLHSLKILTGTNISTTVEDALNAYFDEDGVPTDEAELEHEAPGVE